MIGFERPDELGEAILRAANPVGATYARAEAVDVRISARPADGRSAEALAELMAALGTLPAMELHHLVAPAGIQVPQLSIGGVGDHQYAGTGGRCGNGRLEYRLSLLRRHEPGGAFHPNHPHGLHAHGSHGGSLVGLGKAANLQQGLAMGHRLASEGGANPF